MCRPDPKATKGFSKREIADNVEGGKVEVLDHIDFSAFFCVLSHVADEEANILLNQRLLFSKLQCVLLQRLEFCVSILLTARSEKACDRRRLWRACTSSGATIMLCALFWLTGIPAFCICLWPWRCMYISFQALSPTKDSSLGLVRTTSPYCVWSFSLNFDCWPRTKWKTAKRSVALASLGPGNLLRGWKYIL